MTERLAGVSCEQCGAKLDQRVTGRPARFCTTSCRNKWHNKNPNTAAVRISVDMLARVDELADALVVSPRRIVEAALEQWFESAEVIR